MMYNLGDKLIHRVSKTLWTVESEDKGIYVIVMRIGMHTRHLELSEKELKEDYIKVECEKEEKYIKLGYERKKENESKD